MISQNKTLCRGLWMCQEIESSSNGLLHLMVKLESAALSRSGMNRERENPIFLPHSTLLRSPSLGPCTYDVRTGGSVGFKNCPILWTNSIDRLREMQKRGGQKSPKCCIRHLSMAPLSSFPPFLALEQSHPLIRRERASGKANSQVAPETDGRTEREGGHRWSTGEPSIGRPLLRPPAPPRQPSGGEPTDG